MQQQEVGHWKWTETKQSMRSIGHLNLLAQKLSTLRSTFSADGGLHFLEKKKCCWCVVSQWVNVSPCSAFLRRTRHGRPLFVRWLVSGNFHKRHIFRGQSSSRERAWRGLQAEISANSRGQDDAQNGEADHDHDLLLHFGSHNLVEEQRKSEREIEREIKSSG